jgi:hypothetical protein
LDRTFGDDEGLYLASRERDRLIVRTGDLATSRPCDDGACPGRVDRSSTIVEKRAMM